MAGNTKEVLIIGDSPFGLSEEDAKFARLDARKFARRQPTSWGTRSKALFESTPDDALIERMNTVHTSLADMERQGLTRAQILRELLTGTPEITDYKPLLVKAPWGERLRSALYWQEYNTDGEGALWSDFVMSRIHRALGGDLQTYSRYDGRYSYQITTDLDVLSFDPESNAHLNDGPEVQIRGNRIPRSKTNAFDTDKRFHFALRNIKLVRICEEGEKVEFVKAAAGSESRLTYQQQPIGSTSQIELS